MRIRKRQVPLPLSSLLPVPLSDLYFNRLPTDITRYFYGGVRDNNGGFGSLQLPSPISDSRDVRKKKEEDDDDDNDDIDVDMKNSTHTSVNKNINLQENSDISKQVIQKNVLRKRRSYISFEEEEGSDRPDGDGDGGGKGKKKAKRSGGLEEGSRCSRVNGRGWRCCQQTLVGYSLCEHHLGKGRVRSMNKSGGGRGGHGGEKKPAVVVEVKKKKVKLGMVKARSISSLLGQTSCTTENEISEAADQLATYDK